MASHLIYRVIPAPRSFSRAVAKGLGVWLWLVAASGLAQSQDVQGESPGTTEHGEAYVGQPDLRPCSFQQVTPGETRLAEVLERLGTPEEEADGEGSRVLTYRIEPFASVEIVIVDDLVTSIVLQLKTPASSRQIAKELQLDEFDPAPIMSETGQVLGRAYPERGVLLSFAADSTASKVGQLVLEPITAELFVLRVRHDARHRYEQNLLDLEIALGLDPAHPDALFYQAQVLAATGEVSAALKSVEHALQLVPADPEYLVVRAELLARLERQEEAVAVATELMNGPAFPAHHRARAERLLGDLAGEGGHRDYQKAIQHHLNAIKLASALTGEEDVHVRRAAKRVLFDSFLAAAHDIAAGNWQQKEVTVAKWLGSARELGEAMVTQDGGDEMLKLEVQLATLAAQADMQSDVDPSQLVLSIDGEVSRLAERSGDPLHRDELAMRHARALFDAASIEQARDAKLKAFDYASRAAELLTPISRERKLSPRDQWLVGRVFFFVGSCQAVIHQNHVEAIQWYSQARDHLSDSVPPSAAIEIGRQGERFVSMGASYWETGDQETGLDLTRRGLEMMKQANKRGWMAQDKLALPYGNLAAMYRILGRAEEARNHADIASRISVPHASGTTKR